jgi:hypothetical protein
MKKKVASEPKGLIGMGTEKKDGRGLRLSLSVLIVASMAFTLYITCPRMTAMIATETKVGGLNPFLMICIGCLFGIPLFITVARATGETIHVDGVVNCSGDNLSIFSLMLFEDT